ncbi:MAG TPA: hypothetical protein PL143_01520 [Rhodocyclaceae bacterium]|nr:hypothetical protein [Rhodocyclaceae bacterium]
MQTVTCTHCGAKFEAIRSTAKFCSDRCRIGAHRGERRPLASVWLRKAAIELAAEVFAPAGVTIDAGAFDVSFGYPIKMQRATIRKGELQYVGGSAIGTTAIVITPQGDPLRVLDILVHEMIHTATPGAGHRGPFQRIANAVGLLPPYSATTASTELATKLKDIIRRLGSPPLPFDAGPKPGWIEQPDGSFVATKIPEPWLPPRRGKRQRKRPA